MIPTGRPTEVRLERTEISKTVRLSHMEPGSLIHNVLPVYPPIARQSGTEGMVVLHAFISREGSIESLQVVSGHPFLARAALDAVRQWRYRPYVLNGQPVEVETQITVNFTLGRTRRRYGHGSQQGRGLTCEMNITPMIDVLLVLIIIFMMIQPHESGLEAEVPQRARRGQAPAPTTMVLEIMNGADGKPVMRINAAVIPPEELEAKLRDIYKSRQEKILFLKGDAKLDFSEVAHVIDITRSADNGIRVGLITRELQNAD